MAGFRANSPTLAAGNMRAVIFEKPGTMAYPDSPSVVQVTLDRIRLVDLDLYGTHTLLDEWIAPAEILHASVNESQIIVALAGGLLKVFARTVDSKLRVVRYVLLRVFASSLVSDALSKGAPFP